MINEANSLIFGYYVSGAERWEMLDRCPPKAEAAGSNPAGCAIPPSGPQHTTLQIMVWAKVDFNVCTQSGKQSDGLGALPAWGRADRKLRCI